MYTIAFMIVLHVISFERKLQLVTDSCVPTSYHYCYYHRYYRYYYKLRSTISHENARFLNYVCSRV